jgi:hypothetical protein
MLHETLCQATRHIVRRAHRVRRCCDGGHGAWALLGKVDIAIRLACSGACVYYPGHYHEVGSYGTELAYSSRVKVLIDRRTLIHRIGPIEIA